MEFLAGLPTVSAGILVLIFLLIVFQEAVNGFHDTANAVATVIYSNAMKAGPAVALAAFMNPRRPGGWHCGGVRVGVPAAQ